MSHVSRAVLLLGCLALACVLLSVLKETKRKQPLIQPADIRNSDNHGHIRVFNGNRKNSGPHTISSNKDKSTTATPKPKEIMFPARLTDRYTNHHFENCEFSNCVFKFSNSLKDVNTSDVVVIEFNEPIVPLLISRDIRQNKPLIVHTHESPGFDPNRWRSSLNEFDGMLTYTQNSQLRFPFATYRPLNSSSISPSRRDYAVGKIKGAFIYVSHCNSVGYDRLDAVKELSKYIDVGFFGRCSGDMPCTCDDPDPLRCEAEKHSNYRFYLSFENSLCKDYVTEKFWRALSSEGNFVPVAIGGVAMEDYNAVAPPNSFIHGYNFTSIKELGTYLKHLMEDDGEYNSYHVWRSKYEVTLTMHMAACDLCHLAYNYDTLNPYKTTRFADEWNDPKNCKKHRFLDG